MSLVCEVLVDDIPLVVSMTDVSSVIGGIVDSAPRVVSTTVVNGDIVTVCPMVLNAETLDLGMRPECAPLVV